MVEGVEESKPHIPDETFFPTVLMRSGLRVPKPVEVVKDVTGSGKKVPLKSAWYVRMDEHYPWSSHKQRYEAPSHLSTGRPWGPYYVGSYDLGDIKATGPFLARRRATSTATSFGCCPHLTTPKFPIYDGRLQQ